MEFPRIQIVAHAGDLSPRMMQLAVTRPLEEAARTVLGARRVRSKTIRGGAEISVIFNPDADMRYSLQLMQGKADEVRPELPAGTELVVERMTPSLFPIFSVNVTGGLPPADLRDLAVYQLRPLLSRVPGVADVEVLASEEREISVIVDPDRLNAAKLTLEQVGDALKATNQVVSVGRLPKDYRQYLVLTTAELQSVEDVRRVVVAFRQGTPLYLGDLAEVREGVIDRTTLISGNGQPAALLNVARQIRGNILEVADGAWAALKEYRAVAAAVGEAAGRLRPRRVRAQRGGERARRDPDRRAAGGAGAGGLPARLARDRDRRGLAAAHARRHLLRAAARGRHGQPDVARRPRDRDRPRDRRRDRGGREHPPPPRRWASRSRSPPRRARRSCWRRSSARRSRPWSCSCRSGCCRASSASSSRRSR